MLLVAIVNAQTSSPATDPGVKQAATLAERHDTTGTITDYTPDRALVLDTGTKPSEPLHFRFAPKVTYVDTDGKTIEAPGLRKNLRVRVSYLKHGGDLVIDKVTLLE
jgi:hypothetical protein